jgi:hypothetical protein
VGKLLQGYEVTGVPEEYVGAVTVENVVLVDIALITYVPVYEPGAA